MFSNKSFRNGFKILILSPGVYFPYADSRYIKEAFATEMFSCEHIGHVDTNREGCTILNKMTGVKQMKANGSVVKERNVRTPEGNSSDEEFFNSHVVHTYNNT